MARKDLVAVEILNIMGGGSGCATCGGPTANPEYVKMLRQKIEELKAELEAAYPGRTRVEYIDLDESPGEKESESGRLLVAGKYPAPLVVINGQPKYAGYIVVSKIVEEVGNIVA
jgi:hypothetical protein